jgi:hypothetical protein
MARATQRAKSDQPLSAMDSIENLVDRIGKGEVVFFVGAGFSLDSEGNSAISTHATAAVAAAGDVAGSGVNDP